MNRPTAVGSAIKAVIFDVDGVLLDSREANIAWYRAFLAGQGYSNVTQSQLEFGHTNTLRASIAHMSGEADERLDELMEKARRLEGYPIELLRMPDGAPQTLAQLGAIYTLAIVTARIREGMDHFFRFSGLRDAFDVVVTVEDYTQPKPAAEPLLIACRRLGIEPAEAVYIGDAQHDFECALAAGAHFVAFGGAIAGAPMTVGSFPELPAVLQELAS